MKIAIPIWEDIISPVLDTASRLLIVEVEEKGKELSRFQINLDEQDLVRRCLRIGKLEIDILICGAISYTFSRMLAASGIDIIPEISGRAEEILDAYLQGDLLDSRFLMPGCKRNRFGQENIPYSFKTSFKRRRKREKHGQ